VQEVTVSNPRMPTICHGFGELSQKVFGSLYVLSCKIPMALIKKILKEGQYDIVYSNQIYFL
jgi:hypothetical protein